MFHLLMHLLPIFPGYIWTSPTTAYNPDTPTGTTQLTFVSWTEGGEWQSPYYQQTGYNPYNFNQPYNLGEYSYNPYSYQQPYYHYGYQQSYNPYYGYDYGWNQLYNYSSPYTFNQYSLNPFDPIGSLLRGEIYIPTPSPGLPNSGYVLKPNGSMLLVGGPYC